MDTPIGARQRPTSHVGQLVNGCRDGDSDAWECLIDRYERLVFAVAAGEGLGLEDAADVTQTTFEALLAQLDSLRDDEQVASWLMTVARRQAWRVLKKRRREQAWADAESVTSPFEAVDPIGDHHVALGVYEAVQELGEPCRTLVSALYFDPRSPSYAEVAAQIGRPVGSIGPTRARCLEHLREIMGDAEAS
ncbi:MAG: sigma-70 family RNA polymerase sigma factor [Actinomycetia bacterium]|nr:sigma-70 family RNA polymerase sigma factor [Actinomycetes bacterium]MCP4226183.1 sigma-70 family RNA polymerase sigma factor [Actinomycetes bacterium]MCP5034431.1 sigma-70 family RNA polymerase sigma factor [Actinomycetes bacterium]